MVVESTYNWYWLVDGLMEHGYRVHLANTAAVPQYSGLKHSDDESDARHLAHLLRLGILPEGHIYPRAERGVLDLLRRRFQFVRMAVRLMLSVQSAWARHTGQRRIAMQHGVHVIAHDGVGQHRDREDAGQLDQARFQPRLAVVEAAPRHRIFAAQEGTPNATRYAVIGAGGAWNDKMSARVAHGASMGTAECGVYRNGPRKSVRF